MYTKTSPYLSKIQSRTLLSEPFSEKKTYHIVLEASDPFLSFRAGDSIAIRPKNPSSLVEKVLKKLRVHGEEKIYDPKLETHIPLYTYLEERANLQKCSFHKISPLERRFAPLLDLLEEHIPSFLDLPKALLPLLPRFYSIASSDKMFPGEIHLTVAHVQYLVNDEIVYGVGSHFLCREAIPLKTSIPIYIQPSDHFTLPEDPKESIILIGPGTGIAPFRAFLQERHHSGASGKNWLFFGERHEKSHFYYRDFWEELVNLGKLRLDTAFSRDQENKVYVQHKMQERGKELWDWIEKGARIYVCGDAKKMAKEVELTLLDILREEGKLSQESAREKLKTMRKEKKYLLDVY